MLLDRSAPDYTTLSRRRQYLTRCLRDEASRRDAGLDKIMGANTDQAKSAAAWNI